MMSLGRKHGLMFDVKTASTEYRVFIYIRIYII